MQAARDLYYIHSQLQVETRLFAKRRDMEVQLQDWGNDRDGDMYEHQVKLTSYWGRSLQLLKSARIRRASVAAFIVMISQ